MKRLLIVNYSLQSSEDILAIYEDEGFDSVIIITPDMVDVMSLAMNMIEEFKKTLGLDFPESWYFHIIESESAPRLMTKDQIIEKLRLLRFERYIPESKKKPKAKIIAVDFDGTLCINRWPEIGEPKEKVISYVKSQQANGAKLILWTNRVGERLAEAITWCRDKHGISFDAVNCNLPEIIESFGVDSRKVFANEYLDDRSKNPDLL